MGLTVKHKGIEITYNESNDRWEFELAGHERWAATLGKAREAVEAKPKEKRDAFQRFEAYMMERWAGSEPARKVTVTSVAAEDGISRGRCVWITGGKHKGREKVRAEVLFVISPANDRIIAEIKQCAAERAAIDKRDSQLRTKLTPITLPLDT